MKLLIIADIEGVAGVCCREQAVSGNTEYQMARQLMVQEVNAVVEGAVRSGADEITVIDSHGPMINLSIENISPQAKLVQGKPRMLGMIDGIQYDDYDALMMIGAHSAAGEYGVLAHTINSRAFLKVEVNGHVMGEVDLYGSLAAEFGVPLLMVSGDDHLEAHVSEAFPDSDYVQVKKARGAYAAESLSVSMARELLSAAAGRSLLKPCQPKAAFGLKPPYSLKVSSISQAQSDLYALVPGVERIAPNQVSYEADSFKALVTLLNSLSAMSASLP